MDFKDYLQNKLDTDTEFKKRYTDKNWKNFCIWVGNKFELNWLRIINLFR